MPTPIQTVHDFLKTCQTYYIATIEGDQPRVRPFGTIDLFEDKLYIQTGKKKAVSHQIVLNPKIEITAFDGSSRIRVQAKAIPDDRQEPKEHMLEVYPHLKKIYSPEDDNTQVLYLKDVVATIASLSGESEVFEF
jgi:uncharacterized pyridoxamine 5'-phosphate oxidase family protein